MRGLQSGFRLRSKGDTIVVKALNPRSPVPPNAQGSAAGAELPLTRDWATEPKTTAIPPSACNPLLRLSKNPESPETWIHQPLIFHDRTLRKNQQLAFFDSLVRRQS
jgi:hypothetical protein